MAELVQAAATEAGLRSEQHRTEAAREARRRGRGQKIGLVLVAVLAVVLVILTVMNLSGTSLVFGVRTFSPAEQHQRALADLSFVVEAIDAYRASRGTLPPTLAAVDVRGLDKWTYEISGAERYRLALRANGETIRYDSSQDADVFFAAVRRVRGRSTR
jgi:hypothetical protein